MNLFETEIVFNEKNDQFDFSIQAKIKYFMI